MQKNEEEKPPRLPIYLQSSELRLQKSDLVLGAKFAALLFAGG